MQVHPPKDYLNFIYGVLSEKFHNMRDTKTTRHIVVFESDDWGSLRVPSKTEILLLQNHGIDFFTEIGYDNFDGIASNDDIELLMGVLDSVRDLNNNPAKLTMNCVVANPDFEKIRESGFHKYYYEEITDTFKRNDATSRAYQLWNEGREKKVFQQQFHGREHLNVQMWLQLLQANIPGIEECFSHKVWSLKIDNKYDSRQHVLASFDISQKEEYPFLIESIEDGINIFEKLFGYRPKSMIAPNYTWDKQIEDTAAKQGVILLQGERFQRPSVYARNHGCKKEVHYTGQTNSNFQKYLIRNCVFEPSQNPTWNADYCLSQIEKAFNRNNIAIVCCHRLNFVGSINQRNRDENLKEFKILIQNIVARYPDVEFLSSDQLADII